MPEWWTYSLSDFLLFSPRTYYRLFELYNAAVWPGQVLAVAVGTVVAAMLWKPRSWQSRVVTVLLAACWVAPSREPVARIGGSRRGKRLRFGCGATLLRYGAGGNLVLLSCATLTSNPNVVQHVVDVARRRAPVGHPVSQNTR